MTSLFLKCALFCFAIVSFDSNAFVTDVTGFNSSIRMTNDKVTQSIERIESILFTLEDKFNKDVSDRLDQLQRIIDNTKKEIDQLVDDKIQKVDKVIDDALVELASLENVLMKDLGAAIHQFECAAKRVLYDDTESALGRFGDWIGTHRIKIKAPFIREKALFEFRSDEKEVEIIKPYTETYRPIREFLLGRLKEANNQTPITSVVTIYETLADISLTFICIAPTSKDRFETEYVDNYLKAFHWKNIFTIRP